VILFRPEAARELAADVRYYDEKYPGRGQRFAGAVEHTLALITEFPLAFPMLYEPGIRSAKVARFPYRVVYVVVALNIDVVAVAHAKRQPGYWRDRIA
jgi:plasmid stabilization system protein ParE